MALGTYGYIVATTSSTLSSAEFNMFDEDNYGTYASSGSNNNTLYTSTNGRMTVQESGHYLVAGNSFIHGSTTTKLVLRLKVNGVVKYDTGRFSMDISRGVYSRPFHKILELDSGSYIEAFVEDEASSTCRVMSGSSLSVVKLYHPYGTMELNKPTDASSAQYNPFNTGSAPGSAGILSSSFSGAMAQDPSAGRIQTNLSGNFMYLINGRVGGTGGPNLDVEYYKNGTSRKTYTIERTDDTFVNIALMSNFVSGNSAHVEIDNSSVYSTSTESGSAFSLFMMPTASHYLSLIGDTTANSQTGIMNPFDEDIYSSYSSSVMLSNGITYNPVNGRFFPSRSGVYFGYSNLHIAVSSDADDIKINIKKNGATNIYQSVLKVDASDAPAIRSTVWVASLDSSDYMEITLSSSVGLVFGPGSSMAFYELLSTGSAGSGGSEFTQSGSNNLINRDFTLNTYGANNLTNQYTRTVKQVPFILGTPGPLSLRGRTTGTVDISLGDSKEK